MMSTAPSTSAWYFTADRQRAHRLRGQAVGRAQARQAIGQADEVGGEAGAHVAADPGEVAQRAQPEPLGQLGAHRHRVGVLEAERRQPADVELAGELARDGVEHRRRIALERRLEDDQQARCRCTRERRRWRRSRSAGKTISVPPRPNRRVAGMPRASRICANSSPSRYDSPNGLVPTTTGRRGHGRPGWRRRLRPQPAAASAHQHSQHDGGGGAAAHDRPRPNRARSSSAATYGVAGCATSASGRSTWASRPWCITAMRSASSAGLVQVVGDQQRRQPRRPAQVEEHRLEVAAGDGVERAEGLVEQQRAGAGGQRPGERDALPLPARQLVRPAGGELRRRQADQFQGRRRRRRRHRAGRAATAPAPRCGPRSSAAAGRRPAARSRASAGRATGSWPATSRPSTRTVPASIGGQRVEGTQQRALARSALAHQRHAFAGGDVERRVVERDDGRRSAWRRQPPTARGRPWRLRNPRTRAATTAGSDRTPSSKAMPSLRKVQRTSPVSPASMPLPWPPASQSRAPPPAWPVAPVSTSASSSCNWRR